MQRQDAVATSLGDRRYENKVATASRRGMIFHLLCSGELRSPIKVATASRRGIIFNLLCRG